MNLIPGARTWNTKASIEEEVFFRCYNIFLNLSVGHF